MNCFKACDAAALRGLRAWYLDDKERRHPNGYCRSHSGVPNGTIVEKHVLDRCCKSREMFYRLPQRRIFGDHILWLKDMPPFYELSYELAKYSF